MNTDSLIWDKFRGGDISAIETLYFQNVQFLYRYGRKFSPDVDLVKDAIHDMFIYLIQNRTTLGPTDNVNFYLMRSFRRMLLQNLKKSRSDFRQDLPDSLPEFIYSVEENLIKKESARQRDLKIRQCLAELNPRQREILYYRFECNFTYEQICEIMSIKYDSARKLVYRAIETLRQMFVEKHTLQLFLAFFKQKRG